MLGNTLVHEIRFFDPPRWVATVYARYSNSSDFAGSVASYETRYNMLKDPDLVQYCPHLSFSDYFSGVLCQSRHGDLQCLDPALKGMKIWHRVIGSVGS